jgi:hypothetical protein
MGVDCRLEITAYHEAGHAVAGYLLGYLPIDVTIERDGAIVGRTNFDPMPDSLKDYLNESREKREYIRARVITECAGTIATDIKFPGRSHDEGDTHDHYWTEKLMEETIIWEGHIEKNLAEFLDETRTLLNRNWLWVEAVAAALLDSKSLTRLEIFRLKPEQ